VGACSSALKTKSKTRHGGGIMNTWAEVGEGTLPMK